MNIIRSILRTCCIKIDSILIICCSIWSFRNAKSCSCFWQILCFKESFDSFKEEITKVSGIQEEMWGILKDEEDKRLIKTAKAKEAFIVERTGSTTGEEIGMQSWYLKQVIFLDRFIVLSFSATSDYSAYVDEFDDFVNSFDFEV
jgi:hypothetical protein